MIPKVIHFCWFGGKPYPDIVKKCLKSWERQCPDYQIIGWTEENYDVTGNPYILEAYQRKKWAFVSDYARLDIIYKYGGIYLDTDVELIKSLDPLLTHSCFVASDGGGINTGLGFGAEKGNSCVKQMMDIYNSARFIDADGNLNLSPSTYYNTLQFENAGLELNSTQVQHIKGAEILPPEYFSPYNSQTFSMDLTENTYGIHWGSRLWETGITKVKARIRLKIGINNTRMIKSMLKRMNNIFHR